jgi:hypothetical protein
MSGGAYIVKCSARFTVTLVVGGKNFDITNDQLVIPVPGTGKCRLAVAGQSENMWLFGDPLIRQVDKKIEKRFFVVHSIDLKA